MKNTDTRFPRRTFVTGAAAIGAMAVLNPTVAFADEIADKQAEADAAYASLKAMQATLEQTSDQYTEALQAQEDAKSKMDEAQAQIDEANNNIATLQTHLGNSVRSTYRSGTGSFLDVLMGASTFEEFATSLDLLNDISEDKAETVVQIKDERTALQAAKDEYAEQERVAAEQAESARQAKEEAAATVSQYEATYNALSSEVAQLVEQKRQAEEAAAAAQAAATVAASAQQGAASERQSNSGGGSSSNGGGGPSYIDDDDDNGGGSGNSGGSYEGGSDAVSRAYACLGAPYVWGAVGPSSYDCSGLVSYCLSGSHSRIFTSSSLMGYSAVSNPSPGDVCVKSGHCGIYIGGGQMIHAADYGIGVIVGSVQSGMKIVRP